MELASRPWSIFSSNFCIKEPNMSAYSSLYRRSSLPSSSSSSSSLHLSSIYKSVSKKYSPTVRQKRLRMVVHCSQLKVKDDIDAEACELVNGLELEIGEGEDAIDAYLFQAVKNNNGVGILLLSDIFGFQDSYTRDFAYRVACNGYNVLVPDLFRGDQWSKDKPKAQFEQWINKQDPTRIAKDIATSTNWMADEFMAAELPTKLGIIGFCFGGGRVPEVLAKDQGSIFGTGVSFYGTRMDTSVAPNIKVPVLFITGDNDPVCSVEMLNEFEKIIGDNSRVVVFEDRGHGFVHRPESPEEDADAEEAFTIMRIWLHDQLADTA